MDLLAFIPTRNDRFCLWHCDECGEECDETNGDFSEMVGEREPCMYRFDSLLQKP